MDISDIVSFIGTPINALTLIVVGMMLFFQLVDRGYLRIGKNVNPDEEISLSDKETILSGIDVLTESVNRLAQYANHDTTALLTSIVDRVDELRACIGKLNTKLDEIQKYGVKILKE